MANNRIYLRCKQCGDVLYLGKTFSSCYYYNKGKLVDLVDKLNEFYEKHDLCFEDLKNNIYEPKLDETKYRRSYDNQFDICYECYEESKEDE